MKERKRYTLNQRVTKTWLRNLQSASELSGKSQSEIVEVAVDIYLDKHFKELITINSDNSDK